MKWSVRLLSVLAVLLLMLGQASAVEYGFYNITNNNPGNIGIGEAQLGMDVTQYGDNILFTFTNTGPKASSITDIYFDDDVPLLSYVNFIQMSGVAFDVGANPGNLPGGKDYYFTSNYSYDSDSPVQPNGVNPGEALGIIFSFMGDYGFDDIISALNDESLRVGLHVQGFAAGGSEGFINSGAPVPEPSAFILLGGGLLGLGIYGRRRVRK